MATITIIAATTDAVTAKTEVNAQSYESVTLVASGLANAETCPVYVGVPGAYVPATDASGSSLALTATAPALTFNGGGFYYVTKDATAGSCGVFAIFGAGIND